jgi:tetratricopeptide (TPR) repeat protein
MQFDGETIDLDMIGVLEGTDKSSAVKFCWDYLRHYQPLFDPWRDQPINMIEIGIAQGSSLKVWKSYFSRANIVGIDINPECAQYASDRVTVEIGSQIDPGFLQRVCEKYPPQIVIDDGSHQAQHIVFTFEHLFPSLLPGGIYIVEDTGFHFGEGNQHWIGDGSVLIQNYFADLARDRMKNGRLRGRLSGKQQYILNHVDEIAFIGCAIVIRKRGTRDIKSALAFADAYIAEHGPAWEYFVRLGGFIVRQDGPLERALELGRKAIEIGGDRPTSLIFLIDVLARMGRPEEALSVAKAGVEKFPRQAGLWESLTAVQKRLGNAAEAAEALKNAVELRPNVVGLRRELSQLLEQSDDLPGALAEARKAMELADGSTTQKVFAERIAALRERLMQHKAPSPGG